LVYAALKKVEFIFLRSALVISACAVVGCESAVDPYAGAAEPYTMWGVMNSAADTQKVRIFEITGEPGIDRSRGIDAVVSSTNLTTGEHVTWRHREVTFEEGEIGHIFWAPFRAQEGNRYRVEVVRSDGAASTAEVTLPTGVEVELNTSDIRTTLRVRITGGAPQIIGVEVRYEATNLPPSLVWPVDRKLHPVVLHPVDVSYQDELASVDGGWTFEIQMQRDYQLVRSEYERNCLVTEGAPDIALRRAELRFVAADSAWNPPGGVFDPGVLVEPGALSNVENGFGFLGAGQVVKIRWTPPREVRDRVGYSDERPCNFSAQPIPACMDPPIPCMGENPQSIWDIFFS
jgi:hypothetical protein